MRLVPQTGAIATERFCLRCMWAYCWACCSVAGILADAAFRGLKIQTEHRPHRRDTTDSRRKATRDDAIDLYRMSGGPIKGINLTMRIIMKEIAGLCMVSKLWVIFWRDEGTVKVHNPPYMTNVWVYLRGGRLSVPVSAGMLPHEISRAD